LQGLHTLTAHVDLTGMSDHPSQTLTKEITVLPTVKTKKQSTPFPGASPTILVLAAVALIIARAKRTSR